MTGHLMAEVEEILGCKSAEIRANLRICPCCLSLLCCGMLTWQLLSEYEDCMCWRWYLVRCLRVESYVLVRQMH